MSTILCALTNHLLKGLDGSFSSIANERIQRNQYVSFSLGNSKMIGNGHRAQSTELTLYTSCQGSWTKVEPLFPISSCLIDCESDLLKHFWEAKSHFTLGNQHESDEDEVVCKHRSSWVVQESGCSHEEKKDLRWRCRDGIPAPVFFVCFQFWTQLYIL